MCRMFALVAARPVAARELLRDAPRSLWSLSREHKDGWGVALRTADEWIVHRSTACAAECPKYDELSGAVQAQLLIAHVRKKTVGDLSIPNTHPFRRGPFVFAHNGTVRVDALASGISSERLGEIEGDTDSERLFAFVLTRIDEAGDIERGVVAAVNQLHAIDAIGSANFLLSRGLRMYAHRLGRSLFALTRHSAVDDRRTAAVVIASERITGEAWRELPERSLTVIDDMTSAPQLRTLIGSPPGQLESHP